MKNEHDIRNEVEKTMQSLDGMERAKTDDLFYSRLESRLEERESETPESGWSRSMAYGVAAASILILFNILTVLLYEQSYGDNEAIREEHLQAFAEEYQLDITTIYELNSEE